ncbi:MAG: DUF4105 domain-containing protein [Ferruginibacter sp.]
MKKTFYLFGEPPFSLSRFLWFFAIPFQFKSIKTALRLFLVFTVVNFKFSASAQDSSHLKISLLTCTPGDQLYSTFGHTAIRVTDSISLTDYVFNYGSFRFDDPNFYIKFIRGKLLYYLSVENFPEFIFDYQAENRGITEQVLNMDASEKIALRDALYENSKEENKFYKYDFFLDNCTTRSRDVLVRYKKDHPGFKPVMPEGTRFRQAIHEYLDKNQKYWSKLGIDLLLGAPTDAVMTTAQSQFLPDNLMKSFDSSNQAHPLVLSTTGLYAVNQDKNKGTLFTPMTVFALLLAVITLLSFSPNVKIKNFLQGFDGLLFFFTGLLGILFIFMWTGTDHSMTKSNYNLLWAWPTHILAAYYVNRKNKWARMYFGLNTAFLIIILLIWAFLPQQLNVALIPFVLLLAFRSARKFLPAFAN